MIATRGRRAGDKDLEQERASAMTTQGARTPLTIILEEHRAIEVVLGYLDRALDLVAGGRIVDAGIFRDLLAFATGFVGQCHHGKEEQLLFPALRRTSPRAALLIATLEQEHGEGTRLTESFAAAVARYAAQGLPAAAPLIAAGRAYSHYLREHMRRENEELLAPLPGTSVAFDATLVTDFDRYELDVMGAGTHERLHRMIDTLAPRLEAVVAGAARLQEGNLPPPLDDSSCFP